MTTYVVDANVAVKWLVFEELSELAAALSQSDDVLVAPRIIMTEVANALARKAIRGEMSSGEAELKFSGLEHFFDELIPVGDDMIQSALRHAIRFRHPIYDLIYLEIARRRGMQLLTADRRFVSKLAGTDFARDIILLSDWRAA